MISIRHFTEQDAADVQRRQYPEMPVADVADMIAEWNAGTFQGRYFEMFAVTADGRTVGSVSLYGHTKNVVSAGIEITPEERGKGYAAEAMRLAMNHARELGYKVIQDQVRTDNQASIAMHESLGFETDGYVWKNAKGSDVLLYLFCL